MRESITKTVCIIVFFVLQLGAAAQVKRLYIANDDHTDYMWTANEKDYDSAIVKMIDWWIDYNDLTSSNAPEYRSKWNCDGSFWVRLYEKYRSPQQFAKLIRQIKGGQITVPYSPLVVTNGGIPAEAILRGMFYAGSLERRDTLNFDMATAMENQTLPVGLSSLWKGSGAKYCWHGVCACFTDVPGLTNRQKQIYWYTGLDTNKILLKWYNLQPPPLQPGDIYPDNRVLGGYAEARFPLSVIDSLSGKCNTPITYPYNIAAAFGVGWDDLQTMNDQLINAAMTKTNPTQQVIVSNEVDFFQDFELNHGGTLPNVTETYGNDWDLACASIAAISGKMKRSVEKLRSAEAMAAIVINYDHTVFQSLDSLKREAWLALGLFWEHSLGFGYISNVPEVERVAFQIRLETTFSSYVDQLYNLALSNLSNAITKDNNSNGPRFFAFNPLGWERTDYADYPYFADLIPPPIRIFDVSGGPGTEVPFQFVNKNGNRYLRVEAASIPSVGYKVFEMRPGTPSNFANTGTIISPNEIETDSFRIVYTNSGVITSLKDHRNGEKEIVKNGKFLNDLGAGSLNTGLPALVENGPVSVTIIATSPNSLATNTRITLFKKTGRIEIDNKIMENFDATQKWKYAFNITSPEIWHEETGAVIKAKLTTNGGHYAIQNAKYDWATLNHFAAVNETDNSYGISLSNEDCYFMQIGNSSIGFLDENSSEINVLAGGRTGLLGVPFQGQSSIFDQRFAITTHTNYNAATEMKKALEHQNPMVCGDVTNPVYFLPPDKYSFINSGNAESLIWALKPAEDGYDRGIVARVWNLSNSDVTANLSYDLKINLAKLITHVETDINDITNTVINNGHSLPLNIGHNEMKTFRVGLTILPLAVSSINLSGEKVFESNILQWKVNNDKNYKTYELQRSADGQQFTTITLTPATGKPEYDFADRNVDIAIPYYYRLKTTDLSNMPGYSNTVLIKAAKEASNIILFPNPVKDILKANFIISKKTRGQIAIYNTKGEMVKTVSPPLFERGNNYYILPVKELPAGAYIFSVTAEDKKYVKAFIKE